MTYFNKQLEIYCNNTTIYIFLNVYNYYIDEKGFLNKKLSNTNIHIRDPYGIKSVLKEKFKDITKFQSF